MRGSSRAIDARFVSQAHETRAGENDGVELPALEPSQARVDVAAQGLDRQVRPRRQELRLTAQTRGAESCAGGQLGDAGGVGAAEQSVPGVGALEQRRDGEAARQLRRDVFHRMHRDVRTPLIERDLELLDEQALAADRREAPVLDAVALRGHGLELHREPLVRPPEQRGHVLGLPQGQRALARGDPQHRAVGSRGHEAAAFASGKSADFSR